MNPEADIKKGGKPGKHKSHISAKSAMLKSPVGGRGLITRSLHKRRPARGGEGVSPYENVHAGSRDIRRNPV